MRACVLWELDDTVRAYRKATAEADKEYYSGMMNGIVNTAGLMEQGDSDYYELVNSYDALTLWEHTKLGGSREIVRWNKKEDK